MAPLTHPGDPSDPDPPVDTDVPLAVISVPTSPLNVVAANPGGITFPRGEPESDIVWRALIEEYATAYPNADDWRSAPSTNLEIELPSGCITYPSMSGAGEIVYLVNGVWTNSSGAAPDLTWRLKLAPIGNDLGALATVYTFTAAAIPSAAFTAPGSFRFEARLGARRATDSTWSQTIWCLLKIKSEASAALVTKEDFSQLALDFSGDRRFCWTVQKSTATANQDLIPRSICAAHFMPRTGS